MTNGHSHYEAAREVARRLLTPDPPDPFSIVYAIGGLITAGLALVDAVDRLTDRLDDRRPG